MSGLQDDGRKEADGPWSDRGCSCHKNHRHKVFREPDFARPARVGIGGGLDFLFCGCFTNYYRI